MVTHCVADTGAFPWGHRATNGGVSLAILVKLQPRTTPRETLKIAMCTLIRDASTAKWPP